MATFQEMGTNLGARIIREAGFANDLTFLLWQKPELPATQSEPNPIDINHGLFDHENVQFLCQVFIQNLDTKPHNSFPSRGNANLATEALYKKKYAVNAGKRLADWMQFFGYTNDKPCFTVRDKSYAGGIHIGDWGMAKDHIRSKTIFPDNILLPTATTFEGANTLLPGATGPNGEKSDKIKYEDTDTFSVTATFSAVAASATSFSFNIVGASVTGRPKVGMRLSSAVNSPFSSDAIIRISAITIPTSGNTVTIACQKLAGTVAAGTFAISGAMETRYYNVGFTNCVTAMRQINGRFLTFEEYRALSDDEELSLGDYMRLLLLQLRSDCDERGLSYPAFFALDWEQQGPQTLYGDSASSQVRRNVLSGGTSGGVTTYLDDPVTGNFYNNTTIRIFEDRFSLIDLLSCNNQQYIQSSIMRRKIAPDGFQYEAVNNNILNLYYQRAKEPDTDNVDNRFATEILYEEIDNQTGSRQGRTWEYILSEITSVTAANKLDLPLISPFHSIFAHRNRDFQRKLQPFIDRMNDHVLYKTCYIHVKEIFPGCITGNYSNRSSIRGDENSFQINEARNTFNRVPHESLGNANKFPSKPYFRAEFQQPVCYNPAISQGIDNNMRTVMGSSAHYVNTTNANLVGTSPNNWEPNGAIRACIKYGNKIVVGGEFTNTYPYLAQLDLSTGQWSSIGTIDGAVRALHVKGNDLYIGGNFLTAGGIPANYVAKWNNISFSALKGGFDGAVRAITSIGNNIYIAGDFTQADGTSINRIVGWNTENNKFFALGNGLNHRCHALAVFANKLVAAGEFTVAGNVTANRVAIFDTSTETWSALGQGITKSIGGSLLIQDTNNVYLFGDFTNAGDTLTNRISKITVATNGTEKSSISNSDYNTFGTGVNGRITTACLVNTDLYIAGDFTTANNTRTHRIARYTNNSWQGILKSIDGISIHSMVSNGSQLIIGGDFTSITNNANNIVSASCIAVFDGSTWSTYGSGFTKSPASTLISVRKILIDSTTTYFGGDFTLANNVTSAYFARRNNTTFVALTTGIDNVVHDFVKIGDTIYIVGQFTNFIRTMNVTNNTFAVLSNTSFNAIIRHAFETNGNLFVIGDFSSYNGYIAKRSLITNTWSSLGASVNDEILCYAQFYGNICVGGKFTQADNQTVNYIAIWDDNLSMWKNLGQGVDGVVKSIIFRNNYLYVTGEFEKAINSDGSTIAANGFARFNVWTQTWETNGSGCLPVAYAVTSYRNPISIQSANGAISGQTNSDIDTIVTTTENLLVGGEFINADGFEVNNITRWQGSKWVGLGFGARNKMGTNGTVYAFTTLTNNDIILAGAFTSGDFIDVNRNTNAPFRSSSLSVDRAVYAHRIAQFHRNLAHFSGIPSNYGISENVTRSDGNLAFRGIADGEIYAICLHYVTDTNRSPDNYIFTAGSFTRAFTPLTDLTNSFFWSPSARDSLTLSNFNETINMVRVRVKPRIINIFPQDNDRLRITIDTIINERFPIYRYTNNSIIYASTFTETTSTYQTYYDAQPFGGTNREIFMNINKQRVIACRADNPVTVIPYTENPYHEGKAWPDNIGYEANYDDILELWKNFYDQGIRHFFIFCPNIGNNFPSYPSKTLDDLVTSNENNQTMKRSEWLLKCINELVQYKNNKNKGSRNIRSQ